MGQGMSSIPSSLVDEADRQHTGLNNITNLNGFRMLYSLRKAGIPSFTELVDCGPTCKAGGAVASWLVLDSGSSGPGSGPGWGHCVVCFGQDTLLSRCLSPPRCINGYRRNAGGNSAMDQHPIQGGVEILL